MTSTTSSHRPGSPAPLISGLGMCVAVPAAMPAGVSPMGGLMTSLMAWREIYLQAYLRAQAQVAYEEQLRAYWKAVAESN